MKTSKLQHIALSAAAACWLTFCTGCSTQRNTARTRWWKSFNTRYNVYYNGAMAYIDGSLERENAHKDNFTELLPLYPVAVKGSKELGKAHFDKAIEKSQKAIRLYSIRKRPEWTKNRRKTEKDIEWLGRREYNPFLWKAWLLMGRSQFHEGAFEEAAATFSYMSRLYRTQPAIYGKARAWLAKSYIEQGWLYDAEDVIRNMQRDSLDWRAVKEWDYTYADYYIHTGAYEKAIPYLRKVISHEMRRKQRARQWYLMGQLQARLGHAELARQAFKSVLRQHPPYELEFNARIAMSEVTAGRGTKQMVSQLRRMAASDKNKDYLDQVYYAIGNIYLAAKDTTHAMAAYEKGNEKATRNGIEKGVLLLKLGNLYWEKEKFADARRCYGAAIGLLDKDRPDYTQLSDRSHMLDELVPHTDAVHLQDSLQALVKLPENERNAAIDRVIAALKKKEREERDKQAETEGQRQQNRNDAGRVEMPNPTPLMPGNRPAVWYFYNPLAVSQGKATFEKQWGKRENVDNWRRMNKTSIRLSGTDPGATGMLSEAERQEELRQDSLRQLTDSAKNDPHKREYYIERLPFTPEQLSASNEILQDGLFHAGVIFKDKIDLPALAEKYLLRLIHDFPKYRLIDETYYHLYLLYARLGKTSVAESYVDRLRKEYPDSKWTAVLTDPYFKENARFGVQMEDSLYAAAYEAFKAGKYAEVRGNAHVSATRFPTGANRDKFLFIGALCQLNEGNAAGCLADMKQLLADYPQSSVAAIAGMIVKGVDAGRRLHGAHFDMADVWDRRSAIASPTDSVEAKTFTPERDTRFVFMWVYRPDTVNGNQLLFELARFNFTNFLVRNFDIGIEETDGLQRMKVQGFRNYDEALQYARQLLHNATLAKLASKAKPVIISEENLPLLGERFSYKDYDEYYARHFASLKVSTLQLLTEPEEVETRHVEDNEPAPQESADNKTDDDIYTLPATETAGREDGDNIVVSEQQPSQATSQESGVVIPIDSIATPATVKKPAVPQPKIPAVQVKPVSASPAKKTKTTPTATPKPAVKPKKEDTGIDFDDGFGTEGNAFPSPASAKTKEKSKKTEDEYYDLDGF